MTTPAAFPRTAAIRSPAPIAILAGALALLAGSPAHAQSPASGGKLSGTLEAGARLLPGSVSNREWARFGEYRNRYDGAYLPGVYLRFASEENLFVEFRGGDIGRNDQSLWLTTFKPGVFSIDLFWNQTPHIFSTTAQPAGTETAPGVYTLPTPRPLGTTAGTLNAAYFNSLPTQEKVSSQVNVGSLAIGLTPKDGWDLGATYSRTTEKGQRPMGMSMGSPGSNFFEIFEPLDQTTHDLRISQQIGKSKYRLQMGYNLSVFQNAFDRVIADNPLSATDVAGGAPGRGQSALAPDNLAHTVSLSGVAADFPWRTRFTGSFSYSLLHQNEAMLPYTINSAITTYTVSSVVTPIPAPPSGLNGDKRTINWALGFTSRPSSTLNLTARFRRFEMKDETPDLFLPLRVTGDRSVSVGPFEREHYSHERSTGRFEAVWRPAQGASLKLGWNWDEWRRDAVSREVPKTTEHTPRASLDVSVANWLSVRTSVSRGWKRYPFNTYTQVAAAQNPELRKLEMADRNQDRIEIAANVTPPGDAAVTLTYGLGHSDYVNSAYGVTDDLNWNVGADVSWNPQERVTLFGRYVYEHSAMEQRSRTRTSGALLNNLTWDWLGVVEDRLHTVGAGLEITAVPDRLEASLRWDFYDAWNQVQGSNPNGPPTGGTATQNLQATAANFPPFTKRLNALEASVRYHVSANWYATARYTLERFREFDVRTNGLIPTPPPPTAQGDVFMGNDVLNYNAGVLTITFGYNFGMAPGALMRH